jgi:ABC-type phosphate transport system substrate-binding protein
VNPKGLLKFGIVGLASVALPLALSAAPVFADYAPQPGDIVGVGGDTPQYAAQFVSDGDYSGDAGFNAAGAYNRLVTFNATADANGRSAYANGSTEAAPIPLNPTDVLRAGQFPVQRVQSSGAAITALLADTKSPETIDFVFSASEPTLAQQTAAGNLGWGFLHVVQIGKDSVNIVADNTTNAPAGLSIAELLGIYTGVYTTWNALPDNGGGSTDTIVPLLPPSGSSVYKTFLADLKTANGNVTPTLSASVVTVEQNDPTSITSNANSADAIVPFSQARLNLWSDGYFHNPNTAFPGSSSPLTPGVKILSGTTPDAGAYYNSPINDYIIFRQSDATDASPMEPGGSRNWVKTLFSNSGGTTPFFGNSSGQALIAAAGVTPFYDDLGNVSNG